MKIILNEKVRILIKERGITQKHIANQLNISQGMLGHKLDGDVAVTIKELNKLWSILLVSIDKLLTKQGLEAYEERIAEMEYLEEMEDAR